VCVFCRLVKGALFNARGCSLRAVVAIGAGNYKMVCGAEVCVCVCVCGVYRIVLLVVTQCSPVCCALSALGCVVLAK
jgi:hypothetical protein